MTRAEGTNPSVSSLKNHGEHIKWLLGKVKTLSSDLETTRDEVKRLRERIERSDSE